MNRHDRRAQWIDRHRAEARSETAAARLHTASAPNVRLHIDELVLYGFPVSSRHSIGEATQQGLIDLIATGGVPAALTGAGSLANLDAGSFTINADATAASIGTRLAAAVYGDSTG